MKNLLNYFTAICVIAMFSSCASLTGFEEGRSLGAGNSEFGVTANYVSAPDIFNDDNTEIDATVGFPNIELNYKYGATEDLDIGGRVSTNLNANVYSKYQVVGGKDSKFAFAPGIEVGTVSGLAYYGGVNLYTSIYPSDLITININPRFIFQSVIADADTGVNYIGGNGGLLIGRKHKFGIDFGYYSVGDGDSRNPLITFGIGGKFRFGDNISTSSDSGRKRR